MGVSSCSRMRHLLVLLLSILSSVAPRNSFKAAEHNILDRNAPRNPGLPLGPADFHLARQMDRVLTNETAEGMMKPVTFTEGILNFEELELKGAQTGAAKTANLKNGLSKLTYHWPNGVVLDTIPGDGGCYAIIPYRPGGGRHEVGLEQNGCVTLKITVHELLHALGIKHEQCRPDRDDYVVINWSNIRSGGASQYLRDAWASDDESSLPAKCETTGASGENMQDCYSGWRVDACGEGYDFTSVMHYSLKSFAIDYDQNTVTPKDSSITEAGNTELSAGDIKKLQCMYNCDGTTYNGCGGHVYGDSGTLDALDDDKCQWMIRVDDGFAVEISVITFDVDCSNKLEMYEGSDATGGEIGKYCNDNTPGLVTSQTSSVYINWNNPGSNKFKATWKKVAIVCCSSVRMESSGGAASMYSDFMVTWVMDGEINNRPIYTADGGSKWMAVKTVSGNYIPSWIVSLSQFGNPGSSSGLMFGQSSAPKCPTAVSTWDFLSQTSGQIESDATLRVVCDGGCSADPPSAPADSTSDWDGSSKGIGTVVTYSCTSGDKKYVQCKADGTWSLDTVPECGDP